MTHAESGQLCLFSCLLGENAEWFLPSLDPVDEAVNLQDLICNLLNLLGYEPVMFETETEARIHAKALISEKMAMPFFCIGYHWREGKRRVFH